MRYGYGVGRGLASAGATIALIIVGVVLAIAATIVLFILVLPEKKRAKLPGFFKVIHDILNVKFLVIEKILHFFYVLNTMLCIFVGFFMLFISSMTLAGFLLMLLGPVIVRLVHEGMMLMILLVKNTMEINQKLGGKAEGKDSFGFAPEKQTPPPAPEPVPQDYPPVQAPFYQEPQVQPEVPQPRICRHCGSVLPEGSMFCQVCGNKVD